MNFAAFLRSVASHVRVLRGPHSNYLQDVRTTNQIRKLGGQQKIHDDLRLLSKWLKHERPGQRNMVMVELSQVLEAIRLNLLDLLRFDYERGLVSNSDNFDDRETFQKWHKQCELRWRWLDSCFKDFENVYSRLIRLSPSIQQESRKFLPSDLVTSQKLSQPKVPTPAGKKSFQYFREATDKNLDIVRILEVVDTRQYIEVDERWVPVRGSGVIRPCDRCGRDHEVHATVQLRNDKSALVGTGCMVKLNFLTTTTARSLEATAKRIALLKAERAHYQEVLAKFTTEFSKAEREVKQLTPPPVVGPVKVSGNRAEWELGDTGLFQWQFFTGEVPKSPPPDVVQSLVQDWRRNLIILRMIDAGVPKKFMGQSLLFLTPTKPMPRVDYDRKIKQAEQQLVLLQQSVNR